MSGPAGADPTVEGQCRTHHGKVGGTDSYKNTIHAAVITELSPSQTP